MAFSFIFGVLLVLAVLANSAPTQKIRKRSFKIPRVEQKDFAPNGRVALERAYQKFGIGDIGLRPGGEAAAIVTAALKASTDGVGPNDGTVSATATQTEAQYLCPVTVGGQTFTMNIDTGSSDTWLFNTNVPTVSRGSHKIYIATKSTAAKVLAGSQFNITYGDGTYCSGPVGLDSVDIGGSVVAQQAIGLPNTVAARFVTDPADGLIGLGFTSLSTVRPQKQKTFFENIVTDLTFPVFTAQLRNASSGFYEFGYIDEAAYQGNLTTVPVNNSRGFWEFESRKMVVNGQCIDVEGNTAIADTGTSLMLVGDAMLQGYWGQVTGAIYNSTHGGFVFPCDAVLPDLQVAVGPAYMATVPGEFLNYAVAWADTAGDFCYGGLQSSGTLPMTIYGDVWFRSQFVAFSMDGPSLGIAQHS